MSAPAFASKWQFVYAWVLIGVNRVTGSLASGTSATGGDVVHVWSADARAVAVLPEDVFAIQQITVRDLLSLLPDGVGVMVDPGSEAGMTIEPDLVVELKRYIHPFPGGTQLQFKIWHDLPGRVRDAVLHEVAARPFIDEVRAFLYTIDDGPYLGCIAYSTTAGPEGQDSAIGAINTALEQTADLRELDVASINVVGLVDLPGTTRADLPPETLIHPEP